MKNMDKLLKEIESVIESGLEKEGLIKILSILNCSIPTEIIDEIKLYGDYLPKSVESKLSNEKRYLHFLWDVLDKSPMCLIANFSVPYKRILAKKLFKSCGKNFISEENVRFNIPDNIEIGDDVFINRGTFIDSKGGVKLGNSVAIGEGVTIFTHSHREDNHSFREYDEVIVEDYAKIYSNSTILSGVKIKNKAIVAACSLVNKDVEKGVLVAGIPAKKVRERKTLNKKQEELNHIWLYNKSFQK